jgi:uncharacterized protein YdbL (DUF1318 family)
MQRFFLVLIALVLGCQSALALDLQTAKARGLVGETPTGYLAPVTKGTDGEVDRLVQSINRQRRQEYTKIAQRNNTPLQAVEQLAGKQAMEKTPTNQFILDNGVWRKK